MKRGNIAGMTLVEVLIALLVFALTAAPLFGLFWQGLVNEQRSLVKTLALCAAQQKLEEAWGLDYETLLGAYNGGGELADTGANLTYTCSAEPFGNEKLDLVLVRITVDAAAYTVSVVAEEVLYAPKNNE